MKITVVGTGYVGLVTGVCFAEVGNKVKCVDINAKKIQSLKAGVVPIYEAGLAPMMTRNYEAKRIDFTTNIAEALKNNVKVVFIAVGTPSQEDGSADLQHVLAVAKDIGLYMQKPVVVVDKSTVPVGTGVKVKNTIQKELDKRLENKEIDNAKHKELSKFSIVSNPEFLKEGAAVKDFMQPDRVVVGHEDENSLKLMQDLYHPFTLNHDRIIAMDIKSAELTKYAANAMLATKISFINELSQIAEAVGADINYVRHGIGSDSRIGYKFIYPGVGYGGSCFPKDVSALEKTAMEYGVDIKLLNAVQEMNRKQRIYFINKIINVFGENLEGKSFAIWGLSFKPETDDMREAPATTIINELTKRGAKINAYDPKAMEEAKSFWLKDNNSVSYFDNKSSTLDGAEAMILVTEWKEFRSPDFKDMAERLNNKIIFDGRNQYNKHKLKELGFDYYQIGVRD